MFRHSANYEGNYLAEHALYPFAEHLLAKRQHQTDKPTEEETENEAEGWTLPTDFSEIDYSRIPWAMFTNPQLAGVGLGESDLTLYNDFVDRLQSQKNQVAIDSGLDGESCPSGDSRE